MFRLMWKHKILPVRSTLTPEIPNLINTINIGIRPTPSYRPPRLKLLEDRLMQRFLRVFPETQHIPLNAQAEPGVPREVHPAETFVRRQLALMEGGMDEDQAFYKLKKEIIKRRAGEKNARVRIARELGFLPPIFLEDPVIDHVVENAMKDYKLNQQLAEREDASAFKVTDAQVQEMADNLELTPEEKYWAKQVFRSNGEFDVDKADLWEMIQFSTIMESVFIQHQIYLRLWLGFAERVAEARKQQYAEDQQLTPLENRIQDLIEDVKDTGVSKQVLEDNKEELQNLISGIEGVVNGQADPRKLLEELLRKNYVTMTYLQRAADQELGHELMMLGAFHPMIRGDGKPPMTPEEMADFFRSEALRQNDMSKLYVKDLKKFVKACEDKWAADTTKLISQYLEGAQQALEWCEKTGLPAWQSLVDELEKQVLHSNTQSTTAWQELGYTEEEISLLNEQLQQAAEGTLADENFVMEQITDGVEEEDGKTEK